VVICILIIFSQITFIFQALLIITINSLKVLMMDSQKDCFLFEDLLNELTGRFIRDFRNEVEEITAYVEASIDDAYSAKDNKGSAESIDILVTDLVEGMHEISIGGMASDDDRMWFYDNYGMLIDAGMNYAYEFVTLTSHTGNDCVMIAVSAEEEHFSRFLDLYETLVNAGQSEKPDWCDLEFQRRLRIEDEGSKRLTTLYIHVVLDKDKRIVADEKKDSYRTTGFLI